MRSPILFDEQGPVYLFFSVNSSGQFCGMAQMESAFDYTKKFGCWEQGSGAFAIKWIFIKDVPNSYCRHILLSNNDYKPVTYSRDTQEVFQEPGREMLRIFLHYQSRTSILDDYGFYDKRQELMESRAQISQAVPQMHQLAHGLPPATSAALAQGMAQLPYQQMAGHPQGIPRGLLPSHGAGGMGPPGVSAGGMQQWGGLLE